MDEQLLTSKKILQEKLGKPISLLAWPYGIYDKYLENAAANAGYVMAFSIDDERTARTHRKMAEPRFMVVGARSMKAFAAMVSGHAQ